MTERPTLAVTVGDPVGIGPEITVRTLAEVGATAPARGVVVADPAVLRRAAAVLDLDVRVRALSSWDLPPEQEGVVDCLDIDAAVLNQGIITTARPFQEQGRDEIDRQIAVNLRASMAATRVLLPGMIARGSGHLVFLTSLMARHPFANAAIYGATKAGLHGFAQALRVDLAGTGVRVSEISPGRVETDIWNEAMGGDTAAIRDNIFGPYRALTPVDVAATIRAVMTLPPHVDANLVELSPTDQAVGGAVFAKRREGAADEGAA